LAANGGAEGAGCRFVVCNVYVVLNAYYIHVHVSLQRAINGRRRTEGREIGLGGPLKQCIRRYTRQNTRRQRVAADTAWSLEIRQRFLSPLGRPSPTPEIGIHAPTHPHTHVYIYI